MMKVTPMVAQYLEIKSQYKDCILMYRLGDFYEMFYEDAIIASKILQIALTRRNKSDPDQIMCGIPFHAADGYIAKLTKAGKKVAICEQMTKPDGKGIVKRDVIRVITPGTTFDESVIDNKSNNFVACISQLDDSYALAYCDLTTGDLSVIQSLDFKNLKEEFLKLKPKECILDGVLIKDEKLKYFIQNEANASLFQFDKKIDAEQYLKEAFKVYSLNVFDLEDKPGSVLATALLYSYLKETQKTELLHIQKISLVKNSKYMQINEATINNLELFYTSRGQKEGSLFYVLDNCKTSMGSRLLRKVLIHPLTCIDEISLRQNIVNEFFNDSDLLREIMTIFSEVADIERLISKIGLGTANARDILVLKLSLQKIPEIKNLIKENQFFKNQFKQFDELADLCDLLERAIDDEPPLSVRDGGFIKKGFNAELDELRAILYEGKDFILKMQEREVARSGINNLKVKFNKVFGYYIEISNSNLKNVPQDYIRKQTLVNAERFITPELKEYEEKVLKAEDRIKELEFELLHEIRMQILEKIKEIQINARVISELDLLSCFAFTARKNNYVRPEIFEENIVDIKEGRHPVIENLKSFNGFVPNDVFMDSQSSFLLITGPNMGGKSTYLRQTAIMVLMAQIGSFVPAKSAKIGIVDKIFTRVGANDNLFKGESTFMVEIAETSFILNNATEKSLIIIDELGRGTSTYDGLSLAWAITEHLCFKIKAKTLFATHYHELTDLIESIDNAKNFSVKVMENEDKSIVFLYKIVEGAINRSYGIEVAKLTGLPEGVIERAYEVLHDLELKKLNNQTKLPDKDIQLKMFNDEFLKEREKNSAISKRLTEIDINSITPLEALSRLNELKKSLDK